MNKKKESSDEILFKVQKNEASGFYDLPKNWRWASLKNSLESIQYGYTEVSSLEKIGPKFLRITDIQKNAVDWDRVPYCKISEKELQKYKLEDNDIVVARTGATTGKSYLITNPPSSVFASYLIRIRCNEDMYPKYLWNFMKSSIYWNQIMVVKKGSTQPGANAKILGELIVPVPPLAEQKRIVEKVESLLKKIDEAERLIAKAMVSFEIRRSAILEKAFRDDFYKEKEDYTVKGTQDSLSNGSEWRTFGEVAKVHSKLVDPNLYQEFPHIAPDNIRKYTGELLNYQTIEESQVKSPKHYFYKGQILYSKIRPYLSKVIIAPFDGLCSADMYPINTCLETKYLYWYMLSPVFVEKASTAGSRSVLPKINQKELSSIPVPVPSIEVQKQIVNKIEKILHQEREVLKLIKDIALKLEDLRESILTKAFHGKLGTNDCVEDHSLEILHQDLELKIK